jgi:hypothetical protein
MTNLIQSVAYDLVGLFDVASKLPNLELEARLGSRLDKTVFEAFETFVKKNSHYYKPLNSASEALDITEYCFENRLSLRLFPATNTRQILTKKPISALEYQIKVLPLVPEQKSSTLASDSPVTVKNQSLAALDLKISLKTEQTEARSVSRLPTICIRYKKRRSYIVDNVFQLDFTVIKQCQKEEERDLALEEYQIELEFRGQEYNTDKLTSLQLSSKMFLIMLELCGRLSTLKVVRKNILRNAG